MSEKMADEKINRREIEILIVEDSPTQAEQLRLLLEQQHHRVRTATNGRAALEAVRERKPTLVITDIVMPEMDGYALCSVMKSDPELKDIPVVMVTSLSGIHDIAKSLECGADNFIRKPYEPQALIRRIEYILLNRELRESSRLKVGMEIFMGGKKHFISSGREQILDLLISTYEEAVHMNEELQSRQLEIALSNQTLKVLYRIAADLNAAANDTSVCAQTLKGLLHLPSFRAGWIFLADGQGALRLAASRNLQAVGLDAQVLERDCVCRRQLAAGASTHGVAVVECEKWGPAADGGGCRSHVSVPLFVEGQCLGILNVAGEDGELFGADDVRMLEAVASQVAVAIQRTQLNQHLESLVAQRTAALQNEVLERTRAEERVAKLNRVYAVLSGINTTIVRMHDRDALFKEVCRIAVDLGKFRLAWIGVVDRAAGRLKPVASAGVGHDYVESLRLSLNPAEVDRFGLTGLAIQRREAMIVQDVASEARIVMRQQTLALGLHSFALLPLMVFGEAVGLLALYAGEREFFDEMEMRLLMELSGDIAFALDHLDKAHQLNYLAYYDALTGLPNRSLIHDRLSQLIQVASRENDEPALVALLLIDINRFKSINDALGRHGGDTVLKGVADRLAAVTGSTDRLARIGNDHFAIIVTDCKEAAGVARALDDRLLQALDQPFNIDGKDLHLSFRVGIGLFPDDGQDADQLFANAETALSKADTKEDRYLFYTPAMNASVSSRLTLENKLHRALQHEQFVLHYQPKVDLRSGEVIGMEALIRWNDPDVGLVSPGAFIPILEETGLILDVGRWALGKAIADWEAWQARGLRPPRVAVNVSAVQMRRKDFVSTLEQALQACSGDKPYLELELTESLLLEDIEANVRRLGAVREMGVKIALDDFGTGYSSLSYLKRLPIDCLKIDQSFVRDITIDPGAAAICVAIVDLGHNLKLKVIAEGVETEGQKDYLRQHHCDEMQGYLFSRPLPAEKFAQLLASHKVLAGSSGDAGLQAPAGPL